MNALKSLPAVVVLAAGRGSRYSGPRHKLAETLGQESVLAHTVRHAIASGLPVVVVTTPALVEEASRLVATRDVVVLGQKNGGVAPGGMADSIAAGVAARSGAPGWLILPADMPLVRPETLCQISEALAHHPVVYAQHQGRRGHPVGFGAELYSELVRLSGEEGARRIVSRYPAFGVEVTDPGVLQDLDTVADFDQVRSQWALLQDDPQS